MNKIKRHDETSLLYDCFNEVKCLDIGGGSSRSTRDSIAELEKTYFRSSLYLLNADFTKVSDFEVDYLGRLIYVEFSGDLFIVTGRIVDQCSFLFSKNLNCKSPFYFKLTKDKKKIFVNEENKRIACIDLTHLEEFNVPGDQYCCHTTRKAIFCSTR